MKRIKTNRFQEALEMTIKGNEYAFNHPGEGISHFGLPDDPDLGDNWNQIESELKVDWKTALKIYDMCYKCYFFETLRLDGHIKCDAVKFEQYFKKYLSDEHCKMFKKSKDELSEYEIFEFKQVRLINK